MKIVAPFRPFVPESAEQLRLGAFDWDEALRMARTSAELVNGDGTWFAITDVDTELSVPALKYTTTHRRLMLWILEVSLRYLASDDFDEDTLMMSPDVLMFSDVSQHFTADLGVLARLRHKYQHRGRTILNCAQWWRHDAKPRLMTFYQRALAIAVTLPEDRIVWGADTDPLVQLLSPICAEGAMSRAGLSVNCIDECKAMDSLTDKDIRALQFNRFRRVSTVPMMDFRYLRKWSMAAYFDETVGRSLAVRCRSAHV